MRKIELQSHNTLPVSVIVNVMPNRERFFYKYTLPSIIMNNPFEILINDSLESAPKKWNELKNSCSQDYIYLLSDDFIIPYGHIKSFYELLITTDDSIAYCYPESYYCFPFMPEYHNVGRNFKYISKEFDEQALKENNYIDGSCLFKKCFWVDFDENLKRLYDWDMVLNHLINNKRKGVMVKGSEFLTFCLDEGISAKKNNIEDAIFELKKKWNL